MRGTERAALLTNRLLAFARRQPLEPELTDVNQVILGMHDMLRRTLGRRIALETRWRTRFRRYLSIRTGWRTPSSISPSTRATRCRRAAG